MKALLHGAIALALLALAAGGARACAPSCITAYQFDHCTSAARLDTTIIVDFFGSGQAGFDIPAGSSYAIQNGIAPTTVVEDDFTLVGLPAGTAVGLTARLATSNSGFCVFGGAWFAASLREGAANESSLQWTDDDPPIHVLALPIQAVAGTAFHVRYRITGGAECGTWIRGYFDFEGIPAGAGLVSCNGFEQGEVAARRTSWGAVKALYR